MLLLKDTEKCVLSIQAVDAKGNPAQLDGAPVFSVADEKLLTITTSPDGRATIAAVGPVGTTQVSVTADADLGAGVKTIAATLDVQVIASEAVTLSISAATPEAQ